VHSLEFYTELRNVMIKYRPDERRSLTGQRMEPVLRTLQPVC
jgi:hypothetical protein